MQLPSRVSYKPLSQPISAIQTLPAYHLRFGVIERAGRESPDPESSPEPSPEKDPKHTDTFERHSPETLPEDRSTQDRLSLSNSSGRDYSPDFHRTVRQLNTGGFLFLGLLSAGLVSILGMTAFGGGHSTVQGEGLEPCPADLTTETLKQGDVPDCLLTAKQQAALMRQMQEEFQQQLLAERTRHPSPHLTETVPPNAAVAQAPRTAPDLSAPTLPQPNAQPNASVSPNPQPTTAAPVAPVLTSGKLQPRTELVAKLAVKGQETQNALMEVDSTPSGRALINYVVQCSDRIQQHSQRIIDITENRQNNASWNPGKLTITLGTGMPEADLPTYRAQPRYNVLAHELTHAALFCSVLEEVLTSQSSGQLQRAMQMKDSLFSGLEEFLCDFPAWRVYYELRGETYDYDKVLNSIVTNRVHPQGGSLQGYIDKRGNRRGGARDIREELLNYAQKMVDPQTKTAVLPADWFPKIKNTLQQAEQITSTATGQIATDPSAAPGTTPGRSSRRELPQQPLPPPVDPFSRPRRF
ncbi:MAG: hypothetical protein SFZ03_12230 [Candidatus Melainabacteria bacterium]|nr:hypothetical protein [Candidatus Melainabacteria bacterium]